MSYTHKTVFLPTQTDELCAELDTLSRDGWEFVAWLTGFLKSEPPSRMAIIRRADQPD